MKINRVPTKRVKHWSINSIFGIASKCSIRVMWSTAYFPLSVHLKYLFNFFFFHTI